MQVSQAHVPSPLTSLNEGLNVVLTSPITSSPYHSMVCTKAKAVRCCSVVEPFGPLAEKVFSIVRPSSLRSDLRLHRPTIHSHRITSLDRPTSLRKLRSGSHGLSQNQFCSDDARNRSLPSLRLALCSPLAVSVPSTCAFHFLRPHGGRQDHLHGFLADFQTRGTAVRTWYRRIILERLFGMQTHVTFPPFLILFPGPGDRNAPTIEVLTRTNSLSTLRIFVATLQRSRFWCTNIRSLLDDHHLC